MVASRKDWTWMIGSAACVLSLASCGPEAADLEIDSSSQPITDVDHSSVKRQSIGNCWLYATSSWAEALHRAGTGGTEVNTSESYWTYFHWFEQITDSGVSKINTGGHWYTGADLAARYGWMNEGDFVPGEDAVEMSARQAAAESAINASLASGALSTSRARFDRALVKTELDRAFGLSTEVAQSIEDAFGAEINTPFSGRRRPPQGSLVHHTTELSARLKDPTTGNWTVGTLADVVGTRGSWGERLGRNAWRTVSYPRTATARRNLQRRVQRALHDSQPVLISFFVDFNALDNTGRFRSVPATPGRQGGHLVVMEDYEIENVPGFGTLSAGVIETRADALDAALDPSADISFIRVKNSWGANRPDRNFVVPGYHDLYLDYLNGPVDRCTQVNGTSDPDDCSPTTPWQNVILPAGY